MYMHTYIHYYNLPFSTSYFPNEHNFKVDPFIQNYFINTHNSEGLPQRKQWRIKSLIILGVNPAFARDSRSTLSLFILRNWGWDGDFHKLVPWLPLTPNSSLVVLLMRQLGMMEMEPKGARASLALLGTS